MSTQEENRNTRNLTEDELKVRLEHLEARLVEAEPEDVAELKKVHGELEAVLQGSRLGEVVKAPVFKAAASLSSALGCELAKRPAYLTEAGLFIDAACDLLGSLAAGRQPDDIHADGPTPAASQAAQESFGSGGAEEGAARQMKLPSDADAELMTEYVSEGCEVIDAAESALLDLEVAPEKLEAVDTVFRSFHTIKGNSAFLGLDLISELAHHAENLLSRMRDQEITCSGGYADLALRSVDMLKALVNGVQMLIQGREYCIPESYGQLLAVLQDPEGHGVSGQPDRSVLPQPRLGDILVNQGKADREEVEAAAASQGPQPLGKSLLQSSAASLTDVAQALRAQKQSAGSESSVRIRTDRLDRLLDMVGELVIAQSMVSQDPVVNDQRHHEMARKVNHAGKIVRELQDLSMSLRMVPLRPTFQKMTRLVRDLARKSGKEVQLITQGEDTEIDRHMVDVLRDPLVHLIRNAADHGIEAPEERIEAGKTSQGVLRLSAFHSNGRVVVELKDDGRGLDRGKIIDKAVERGLISSAAGLSDSEVFQLIFAPGFSTAEQVTDVSGRGVGMDVVRRNVESLQGRIQVESKAGEGTTFSIVLPLTMAITDGMLVRVGNQRYIVPTLNISLSFRPESRALSHVAGRGELVLLRGDLIPVFRLHRLFGVVEALEDPTQGILVIVGAGHHRCALLVDELLGQQQVVAKSLGDQMDTVQGISGAAILGDGRVGIILDTDGISSLARQLTTDGGDLENAA